jgi:hypothetical protein
MFKISSWVRRRSHGMCTHGPRMPRDGLPLAICSPDRSMGQICWLMIKPRELGASHPRICIIQPDAGKAGVCHDAR